MTSVAFILSDQMLATSTTWPADMLAAANQAGKRLCPKAAPFKTMTVASSKEAIECHTGIRLSPEYDISDCPKIDIIYLPALWRNPRPIVLSQPLLLSWLQQQFENGTIISGVGTGCCFMAEAGLLNQKPATTHWYYFDEFQKHYPQVQLKRQHFITQAGNLYCAASINSQADLTVHFIQRFLNIKVAHHIERHFSHEVRRPYESIRYLEKHNTNHPDEDILQAQLWLQQSLGRNIHVIELSKRLGMSSRNFTRRFKLATGKTPLQYLQELRLNTAKDLLQASNLSVSEIADKVGYSDVSHFAYLFKRALSVTPKEYRTTVRAKLFHSQL